MATHMLLLSLCSRRIVTRWAGSKLRGGGYLYITFFIIDQMVFHQMLCGILANKIINKIFKSDFKLQIQIYIKHPPSNKSKGKSTTAVYTIPHIQTTNSYDLAPQTERTTVCLAFCRNPSSMLSTYIFSLWFVRTVQGEPNPVPQFMLSFELLDM